MPMTEKEYNGNLLDQLTLLERIEEVAIETKDEKVLKVIEKIKTEVNRKLYKKPSLIDN